MKRHTYVCLFLQSHALISGNLSSGSISTPGSITSQGPINSSNAVTATGDTTLWHGVIWTWFAPPVPCTYGGWCGNMQVGWWPAPSYWWYNTPGYSGCGGNNPSWGVNLPGYGQYQIEQSGSCGTWWRWAPGGPYGY